MTWWLIGIGLVVAVVVVWGTLLVRATLWDDDELANAEEDLIRAERNNWRQYHEQEWERRRREDA
jgi:endonuclease YncB( thermonuclease family)